MKTAMTWIMGGLLVVGAATAFAGLNGANAGASSDAALAASTGRPAPNFSLPDYKTGKPIQLSDYRGKVVLVNFWATWCPPCRREIPDFIRVQNTLRGKGFEIVGISLDEGGAEAVAPFAMEMGINYAVALGNEQVVASYGGIRGIPTSFLIDRQGRLVRTYPGMIDERTLRAAVEALL
ncbi:MAG: peroxiredoxin family protein [Candidatus Sericytochromatia bacterium]